MLSLLYIFFNVIAYLSITYSPLDLFKLFLTNGCGSQTDLAAQSRRWITAKGNIKNFIGVFDYNTVLPITLFLNNIIEIVLGQLRFDNNSCQLLRLQDNLSTELIK